MHLSLCVRLDVCPIADQRDGVQCAVWRVLSLHFCVHVQFRKMGLRSTRLLLVHWHCPVNIVIIIISIIPGHVTRGEGHLGGWHWVGDGCTLLWVNEWRGLNATHKWPMTMHHATKQQRVQSDLNAIVIRWRVTEGKCIQDNKKKLLSITITI